MTQLDGKVTLVTGASAGLGAATAKLFAERGASVFGIARDADRMAEVFADVPGGKYASVDISDPAACKKAVAECVGEFGRLDVLANIAGFHKMRHTPTMTDEEWDKDLAVNLNGPFYLCRAALPHLLAT
jgi:NAD(P)-dependent dehydrogenase (short-subunit alcohol dehydrogenase family)